MIVTVSASHSRRPGGLPQHEICEGEHGRHRCLPAGGHVSRGRRDVRLTTHKTVKRIIERAGRVARRRPGGPRERNYDSVARPGRGPGRGHVGPDLGEAAAARGEGGRVCGVAAELPAAGRRREAGVAARSPPGPPPGGVGAGRGAGDRLGQRGRPARVLRRAGLVTGPVRAVRRQRAVRDHAGDAG